MPTAPDDISTPNASYDPTFFEDLAQAERSHFWFQARAKAIAALIQPVVSSLPTNYRVLEIGCGTGNILRTLEQACPNAQVVGMDLYESGLQLARRDGAGSLVCADATQLPFRADFDVVGLFDVIEHLDDDVGMLKHVRKAVRPGGAVLLTVPAVASLWSDFDRVACHRRRYSTGQLQRAMTDAGLYVEYLSPFMLPLFPMMWLGRRLKKPAADAAAREAKVRNELRPHPLLNRMMATLLAWEPATLRARRTLPLGTSLAAIGRVLPETT